jgi:hypothetical protein
MSFSETWIRNTFSVEAVRVTEENMRKVANWCYGRIYGLQNHGEPLKLYIQFDAVGYNKHYAAKAFVGDWVLFVDGHFKHYEDRSFRKAYHQKVDRTKELREIMEGALSVNPELAQLSLEELTETYTYMVLKLYKGEGK